MSTARVIQVRLFRRRFWEAFECKGVEPFYLEKRQAIDYAIHRGRLGNGLTMLGPRCRIRRMKTTALFLGFLSAVLLGAAHAAITIQTVTIGDPGNPNDSTTGGLYGGVSYTYAIGTYEVTLLQYTAFLNAVGATDTNALYNPSMGTDLNIAGISRSGASGSFAYSVIGDGNRPVTYVSWFDAARFTNWLHNGQPTGLQTASTTENGAYALLGANSGLGFRKSLGAQYWVPSESEWYKAAYYQPAAAKGERRMGIGFMRRRAMPSLNSHNGSTTDANSGICIGMTALPTASMAGLR